MPAKKLLYLLTREEVSEIALKVGRPACAVVNGALRRIEPRPLEEPEIIAILAQLGGRAHLPFLADGREWDFPAAVGTVRVEAGFDPNGLKVTLRVTARAAAQADDGPPPTAASAPEPVAPRKSQRPPRASQKPPARTSQKPPARISQKPPAQKPPVRPKSRPLSVGFGFSEAPIASTEAAQQTASFPSAADDAAAVRGFNVDKNPSAKVVTMHDAFNFEAASGWTDGPLQQGPAPKKKVLPRFQGDLLDDLLGKARDRAASDLHVLADRPPTLRIAGDLVPEEHLVDAQRAEELILPRVPERMRASLERDGSCDFSLIHPAYGRFRANVSRQRTGIKLTARPIREHIPTLEELGLPEAIAKATHHHQGLIVIAGPTGHGKTTTLAAIVGIINRHTSHHVITVEDPVEFVHPTAKAVISQREVGTHTKSFQAALKGSLREDPDVIVVGELRDTETVRMALSASETGHLVISTMNTPSAAKAIERLIDLFPPGDQPQVRMTLAGGLRLIVAQRLIPNADRTGLCAAAEVLPGNLPLWNLIRENRTYQIASLQQRGKALGIVRLDESLAALVRAGKTTMEIAKTVAEQPEHLEAYVAGRSIIAMPDQGNGPAAVKRPGQATPADGNPAINAAAGAGPAAAAAAKKTAALGKTVLSRAGRLFGSESE